MTAKTTKTGAKILARGLFQYANRTMAKMKHVRDVEKRT